MSVVYPTTIPEIGGGGAAAVTPQATQQDWPAAFTTADPGAATWTWTAPDGTDQSAHLTDGDGDTMDYAVNGLHVIAGLDAAGGVVALHEIMLGDPAAVIPGAMVLPDWDTLSKHDPRAYDKGRGADYIELDGPYYGASSVDFIWLYTTITIPTGKSPRLWYVEDGSAWTQRNIHSGCFLSSDATDPAGAAFHAYGGNFRYWLPNRGKPACGQNTGVPSQGNENTGPAMFGTSFFGGPDGNIKTAIVLAATSGAATLLNNTGKTMGGLVSLGAVAHIGVYFGRTQSQAQHRMTGKMLVEVS